MKTLNLTLLFGFLVSAFSSFCIVNTFAQGTETVPMEEEISGNCPNGSEFATPQIWYEDYDEDGFGDPEFTKVSCNPPDGYVLDNTDCSDFNVEAFPGGPLDCALSQDPPISIPLMDQKNIVGNEAVLDGSESFDPDNGPNPLTYNWRFVSLADGSSLTNADISNANSPIASFIPDVDGIYSVELEVFDGIAFDSSQVETEVITCIPAPDPDLNNDGRVTLADLRFVTANFGFSLAVPEYSTSSDVNCDGEIDNADLKFVLSSFGKGGFPIN